MRTALITLLSAATVGAALAPALAPAFRKLPTVDRPVGVPAMFGEHAKLMFDLQVLATSAT
jgi:hypothetical protein